MMMLKHGGICIPLHQIVKPSFSLIRNIDSDPSKLEIVFESHSLETHDMVGMVWHVYSCMGSRSMILVRYLLS